MLRFNDTACRFFTIKLLLLCVLITTQCSLNAQSYDITSFGAKADGVTDNTAAIQKAIDECSKTGGKVIFPAGTYLSGTLMLKSNTTVCTLFLVIFQMLPDKNHSIMPTQTQVFGVTTSSVTKYSQEQ